MSIHQLVARLFSLYALKRLTWNRKQDTLVQLEGKVASLASPFLWDALVDHLPVPGLRGSPEKPYFLRG